MNKKQKIVMWFGLGAFFLSLTAAPWVVTTPIRNMSIPGPPFSIATSGNSYATTAPIWDGPLYGELNVGVLLLEWLAIVVIVGVLVLMTKSQRQPSRIEFKNN